MKIRVGDRYLVRDAHTLADRDFFRTHEHRTDQRGIVTNFHAARWFDIERSPGIDANAVAQNQARIFSTAKTPKAITPLDPAIASNADIGGKRSVVPIASYLCTFMSEHFVTSCERIKSKCLTWLEGIFVNQDVPPPTDVQRACDDRSFDQFQLHHLKLAKASRRRSTLRQPADAR